MLLRRMTPMALIVALLMGGASLTAASADSLPDRSLHLAGAPNARDVGGYQTADGHWVRMGLAYRSGELGKLTSGEWDQLRAGGVDDIVDLRTGFERRQLPDNQPAGIGYQVADVFDLPPGKLPSLTALLGTVRCVNPVVVAGTLTQLATGSDPEGMVTGATYPIESCYFGALDAYHDLLTAMSEHTVVFHCTYGKDRTGVGAAILLTILGVPRETVIQDYLDSNNHVSPTSVRRAWIQSWFDSVDASWGSFSSYVRNGLGISDATVAALKQKFLA